MPRDSSQMTCQDVRSACGGRYACFRLLHDWPDNRECAPCPVVCEFALRVCRLGRRLGRWQEVSPPLPPDLVRRSGSFFGSGGLILSGPAQRPRFAGSCWNTCWSECAGDCEVSIRRLLNPCGSGSSSARCWTTYADSTSDSVSWRSAMREAAISTGIHNASRSDPLRNDVRAMPRGHVIASSGTYRPRPATAFAAGWIPPDGTAHRKRRLDSRMHSGPDHTRRAGAGTKKLASNLVCLQVLNP